MSSESKGEGWWLANDGQWYPPDASPGEGSGAAQPWLVFLGLVLVVLGAVIVAAGGVWMGTRVADDVGWLAPGVWGLPLVVGGGLAVGGALLIKKSRARRREVH